ncbi:type II toxin-antitoxin system RelE/ParE family toxin [Litorivivens sp.]|uniref:type II toxin-antitoxin system RelE/ParE family toxin n=1 Tax=Litorivivens sp. TaxID=2020868 RepID=UPI003563C4DF
MIIIETSIFTKRIKELMSDDDYKELQESLVNRPDMGAVIPGSGGLRKMRWRLEGRGKSGGVRVIYYWLTEDEQVLMLYVYPKSEQDNLTAEQTKVLKVIVERWSDEK